MDNNDLEISGDWHVVSSVYSDEKEFVESKAGVNKSSTKENEIEGSRIQDIADHDLAACNESSSSDIDIIDENLDEREEAATSCFLPSSLTISSTIEKACDTCSGESTVSSSETAGSVTSPTEATDTPQDEDAESSDENVRDENSNNLQSDYIIFGKPIEFWAKLLLEYLQNLSPFQWSCLFGLTMCLYFCITINQTNIIALEEKGSVVSQLERMIDELRNDNKQLKEQMLSEMKNDKLVSSFEHQIRELKKDNSKLNHMLYDVVKVLERQKDTQEKLLTKKEADYQAPFKKEINKLKEHINMLKFDNEELQKQLVRMRYASYSQGGKHADIKKEKHAGAEKESDVKGEKVFGEEKSEKEANEKKDFPDELPIDLEQLKKWNELLDLVVKELGIFDKGEKNNDKQASGSKSDEEKSWSWKDEFKNINMKLPHIHVSDVVKKYAKSYEKMLSNIYKSASSYFSSAQKNTQSFFDSFQEQDENSEKKIKKWTVINGFVSRWAQMKNSVLASYQKFNFPSTKRSFENPDVSENVQEEAAPQATDKNEEHSDITEIDDLTEEYKKLQKDLENEKWFFERANLREKLRKEEDGSGAVNWFLRKKRRERNADFLNTDQDPAEEYNAENGRNLF